MNGKRKPSHPSQIPIPAATRHLSHLKAVDPARHHGPIRHRMRRQTMLHWAGSDLMAARQSSGLSTQKQQFNVSVGSLAPDPTRRAESGLAAVQRTAVLEKRKRPFGFGAVLQTSDPTRRAASKPLPPAWDITVECWKRTFGRSPKVSPTCSPPEDDDRARMLEMSWARRVADCPTALAFRSLSRLGTATSTTPRPPL